MLPPPLQQYCAVQTCFSGPHGRTHELARKGERSFPCFITRGFSFATECVVLVNYKLLSHSRVPTETTRLPCLTSSYHDKAVLRPLSTGQIRSITYRSRQPRDATLVLCRGTFATEQISSYPKHSTKWQGSGPVTLMDVFPCLLIFTFALGCTATV